ncbi:8-amino-7-oxononanoate synthase [Candidatus Pandoraea novymonadis]|uniref:8-amino-7-oxononanoate synthase n=1 Tax=Candidatus Pandoraea novymonadis TaxID=1808959 RepID=A0ABX5FFI7_9BURK|nr:8-amino-7-oxononanoate synthase [Candidatus Pandoraea novymonadis]PSB92116.1 8-amino-7-oxononanoate synthase [Candidatus Pandoraea novymonadis]
MNDFQAMLMRMESQCLLRTRRIIEGPQNPSLRVNNQSFLSFCSNDYLGLANHPNLIAAIITGMSEFGVGSSSSALICGHTKAHEDLEQTLAAFLEIPRVIYFSNGYMANLGVISALVGPGDTIFCDRLNHASLIDGARLSRAEFKVYAHSDVFKLEKLLQKCKSPSKLVVTDAVFSMDGDIAHLAELITICERYDAWLLVDDAHGFGVLGPHGKGSLHHFGLKSEQLLYMGTLGKAAGVAGAFVAANRHISDWLLQRARTYMYTTSNPALLATAASAALPLIYEEEWRRIRLRTLGKKLQKVLYGLPWPLIHSKTAIHPIIIGDNQTTQTLASMLKNQGIWVPAICPPTVPDGTARLRISLSALHTEDDVICLAKALMKIATVLKVER